MWSMRSLYWISLVAACFDVGICRDNDDISSTVSARNQPTFKLKSGISMPLIGFGIGNLPHESIPHVVDAQLRAGALLIDTAYASNNEKILSDAIASFDDSFESRGQTRGGGQTKDLPPLHVVTKVWYTHLGYNRTKMSVHESLSNLRTGGQRQIYVHMLLHWPRCNDEIPWMNCEAEENNLPQYVKDAGPPPHLNKQNAFKESWKALEEMYTEHQELLAKSKEQNNPPPMIASIGVSNFELDDMKQLFLGLPEVPPQVYQGNSWMVFHDPFMMDFLSDHGVFFQAYAVMNGILQRRHNAPRAHHILSDLCRELMATVDSKEKDAPLTEATVLLSYFLYSNVGVIPRAASLVHQQENAPKAISAILPHLTSSHIEQLKTAIPALMKGEDVHTSVSFMNALSSPIQIHWVNPDTNEEILVSNTIHPGGVEMQMSHPGHKFVAYDPERAVRKEFLVDAGYGEDQYFKVEL